MATKKKRKYNATANKLKMIDRSKSKVWFIGGNCIDGIQAGGVSDKTDVNYILSRRHQWNVELMAFGIDDNTGFEVIRRESITFNEVIDQYKLKTDLDPYLFDFTHRMGNHAGIDLISTGYIISPSLEADLDSIQKAVSARFRENGSFNRELCRIADEFRLMNKEGRTIA